MEKEFNPLILITKGNEEIKNAYYAGVNDGREKEKEILGTRIKDFNSWIDKRVKDVEKRIKSPKKGYINGYLDAKKMVKKFFM